MRVVVAVLLEVVRWKGEMRVEEARGKFTSSVISASPVIPRKD
jgi:hypothetical protein